jgi:AraC-like DNA-binding protein
MKSCLAGVDSTAVSTKISIGAGESRLWEKLEAMTRIDPSVSGGVSEVVLGRRVIDRSEPIGVVFRSGYEEIHEIEPGFCAHITDLYAEQEWRLTIRSRENNLRFRIAFAGGATYFDRKRRYSEKSLDCSFIIRPAGDALTGKFSGGMQYRYCSLNVTQRYLSECVGLGADELPAMLLAHWQRGEAAMGHFPASKAALALAGRFFSSKSSPSWRDFEVRAIAIELLRVLFENWGSASPHVRASMRITPQELEKLTRIRELIKANPDEKFTIPALCAEFRMNRKKLHYGFKRLCGVSIHEFQTELRMQLAHELLRSSRLPIAQIAEQSGFSEPTNFTAAFKKHFAVLPRQVREGKEPRGARGEEPRWPTSV